MRGGQVLVRQDFVNEITIANGAETCVHTAEHYLFGRVAVKRFISGRAGGVEQTIMREIQHLTQLSHHEHIIQFFGRVAEKIDGKKIIGYAMEYMAHSLQEVIHNHDIKYDAVDVANWGRQACLALSWLHSNDLIHRDVKPSNMLLNESLKTLKLCDFGLTRSVALTSIMTLGVGAIAYMAPELLSSEERGIYSNKCDVYSLGISVWEMDTRKLPFENKSSVALIMYVHKGGKLPIDNVREPVLRKTIESCLSPYPAERPTMMELHEALIKFRKFLTDNETETNRIYDDRIIEVDDLEASQFQKEHTLTERSRITYHTGEIRCLAWNPKNDLLASCSEDEEPVIWSINTINCKDIQLKSGGFALNDNPVHRTSKQEKAHISKVSVLKWNIKGNLLGTGTTGGSIRIWFPHGDLKCRVQLHAGKIFDLQWNMQGNTILSSGADKTAQVWNYMDGAVEKFDYHSETVNSVLWLSDDVFASCSDDGTILLCKINCGKPIMVYPAHEDRVLTIKFDPVSKLLASLSADNCVNLWQLTESKPLYKWGKESYSSVIEWSPLGHLLARISNEHLVELWDSRSQTVVWTHGGDHGTISSMAFNPSGTLLATTHMDGFLTVLDTEDGQSVYTRDGDHGLTSVTWNHNGEILAVAENTGTIILMDVNEKLISNASSNSGQSTSSI